MFILLILFFINSAIAETTEQKFENARNACLTEKSLSLYNVNFDGDTRRYSSSWFRHKKRFPEGSQHRFNEFLEHSEQDEFDKFRNEVSKYIKNTHFTWNQYTKACLYQCLAINFVFSSERQMQDNQNHSIESCRQSTIFANDLGNANGLMIKGTVSSFYSWLFYGQEEITFSSIMIDSKWFHLSSNEPKDICKFYFTAWDPVHDKCARKLSNRDYHLKYREAWRKNPGEPGMCLPGTGIFDDP